jgi:hypothetical protein
MPEFPEYISQVQFTPPPPHGTSFAEAQANHYNPGVALPLDSSFPPVEYNMHVDDNLYAAAGINQMKWSMRCSIAGLQRIMGENQAKY